MRRILSMCLIISFLSSGTALATEQVISVNLLGLLTGTANVEYESVIDDTSTWATRGLFSIGEVGYWSWSGFGVGGSYRRYFSPTAPAGWYAGIGVNTVFISADYVRAGITERGSGVVLGPLVEVGHKWLFEEGFTISAGMDVGYYVGRLVSPGRDFRFWIVGLGLTLALGYAW